MTQASTSKRPVRSRRSTSKPQAADGNSRDSRSPQSKGRGKPQKPPERRRTHLPVVGAMSGVSKPNTASNKAHCTSCGLCCTYVAIEIDGPATVKAATQLLWYVYHEGVSLYVSGEDWMVQFDSTCVHLQADYRCGIYHTRPHICREFSEQDCEVNTGDDGKTFYNADEFMTYLKDARPRVYGFVRKNFAPPEAAPRTRKEPFEKRFAAVVSRREV